MKRDWDAVEDSLLNEGWSMVQIENVRDDLITAGAEAQRSSDATLLRPIACSCAERIDDNPLVTLPKGEK